MRFPKFMGTIVLLLMVFVISCSENTEPNASEENANKTSQVTLIGEGEMQYTCPMAKDMVFSTTEKERCPVCNMKLRKMNEKDVQHLKTLKEKYEIKKVTLSN